MCVSLALFLYVSASTRHVRIYMFLIYIYMVNDFFLKENKQKQRGEHVHAVDVFQSCMLHAAVRVEWVGNLHPNVFV